MKTESDIRKEVWEDLLDNDYERCLYCGEIKRSPGCCGENHFTYFKDLFKEQQEEIVEDEVYWRMIEHKRNSK